MIKTITIELNLKIAYANIQLLYGKNKGSSAALINFKSTY